MYNTCGKLPECVRVCVCVQCNVWQHRCVQSILSSMSSLSHSPPPLIGVSFATSSRTVHFHTLLFLTILIVTFWSTTWTVSNNDFDHFMDINGVKCLVYRNFLSLCQSRPHIFTIIRPILESWMSFSFHSILYLILMLECSFVWMSPSLSFSVCVSAKIAYSHFWGAEQRRYLATFECAATMPTMTATTMKHSRIAVVNRPHSKSVKYHINCLTLLKWM